MSGRADGPESSCRRCPVTCDRVVYPVGCLESGCDRLYAYESEGRRIVGCLEKVFGPEIDVGLLEEAERAAPGFGGLKALRTPLPICRSAVDRAFEHRAASGCCRNPSFLAGYPQHPVGARAPAPRASER